MLYWCLVFRLKKRTYPAESGIRLLGRCGGGGLTLSTGGGGGGGLTLSPGGGGGGDLTLSPGGGGGGGLTLSPGGVGLEGQKWREDVEQSESVERSERGAAERQQCTGDLEPANL